MLVSTALITTLLLPQWLPTGFAWNPGQFPIPYCIVPTARNTSLTQTQIRSGITQAIDYWRSTGAGGGTSCTNYNAAAASYTCVSRVDLSDRKNNIFFVNSGWRYGSQTLGVTSSGGVGNCGNVTDSRGVRHSLTCQGAPDIELNDVNITWDLTGRQTDLVSIMTHEYGHFLGLDHCNDNNTCQPGGAVMYAAYAGGQFRVPRTDDVAGVCGMYPGQSGGVGFPCANNSACTSAQCVNPGSAGYCTAACGTCPTGFLCQANPSFPAGNTCVRDDGTNKAVCEVCSGSIPDACANNGVCLFGIPEQNGGRCVTPCPRPAAPDGGCASGFTCASVQGAGAYCIPRSGDCTNLGSTSAIPFGGACSGDPPCETGLECQTICTQRCTPGSGAGCPSGFFCETFQLQSGGTRSYCAPPVREGETCNGFVGCPTGPCLSTSGGNATCYQDCQSDPNACNNAQTCTTYQLQGGSSVSVCEPPGVPPRPDAGVSDTGAGFDAVGPAPDAGAGSDANMSAPDATETDTGGGGGSCTCDQYLYCEDGCPCDQECPCACDVSFQCDPAAAGAAGTCSCDPECYRSGGTLPRAKGSCSCTLPGSRASAPWTLGLLVVVVSLRRAGTRRRG